MNFHYGESDSNRTQPFSPSERPTENEIDLLLHFDGLSVRNPPQQSDYHNYFDFLSPSEPPFPLDKRLSISNQRNIKCQYCNESYPQDLMDAHQQGCYQRKIFCETCSEMIPIDIFDYHANVCPYHGDNFAVRQNNNVGNQFYHDSDDHDVSEADHQQDYWNLGNQDEYHREPEYKDLDDHDHEHDYDTSNHDEEKDEEDPHFPDYYNSTYTYQAPSNMHHNDNEDQSHEHENLPEEYHEEHWHQDGYHHPHERSESEREHEGEEEANFEPDLRTYEQLMALDSNVVKKGMNEEEMKKFFIELYLTEVDGDARCTVCITDYESGEALRRLSCGHRFHKECIDTWLDHNITCPICKKFLR